MQQLVTEQGLLLHERARLDPSINRVLVTGGTGFIGGAVLAELIDTPLWRDTLILVRANTVAEGTERIIRSLQRFLPDRSIADLVHADQIMLGGLEDGEIIVDDERTQHITHVIHGAAVTSFSDSPKIRAVNVDANLKFLRCLTTNASIRRFVNVGTAWCVGMRASEVVSEACEPREGAHVVPYTASKLEFERRVREEFPELAFVTARPSIVVGHSKLGTKPSGSIYWVFRCTFLLGQSTCGYADKMDVVPVDWVARALIHLATKRKLKHTRYHLSSGLESASSIEQLDNAIAEGSNLRPHGPSGYKKVDPAGLANAVRGKRAALGDVNCWLLGRALSLYGKFAESCTVFDNKHTLDEGIPPPPPFFTYAHICASTAQKTSIAAQMEDDFKIG